MSGDEKDKVKSDNEGINSGGEEERKKKKEKKSDATTTTTAKDHTTSSTNNRKRWASLFALLGLTFGGTMLISILIKGFRILSGSESMLISNTSFIHFA